VGPAARALKWRGSVPSFDPTMSDDVGICLYHGSNRILKAVVPAGGMCGTSPCWTGAAPDFTYLDTEGTPDGVRKMKVIADAITANAAGPGLDSTSQGVPNPVGLGEGGPPVVLQLHTGNSACVEATFDTDRHITASAFSGRSD